MYIGTHYSVPKVESRNTSWDTSKKNYIFQIDFKHRGIFLNSLLEKHRDAIT